MISLFWFTFALLSGSADYGGGLKGIIMNSPNALPWAGLLIFVYFTFKWELVGGILLSFMGLFTIFAFNAFKHHFVFFIISLPLIILGLSFIYCWYLSDKNIKK
jgi:hypothetical protein